jgi:methyl-accepting chemotaxis protein
MEQRRNLTLGQKLSSLVAFLLFLLASLGVYAIINAKSSAEGAKSIAEDRLIPAVQIGTIVTNNAKIVIQLDLATMHDPRLPDSKLHSDHGLDKHYSAITEIAEENSKLWKEYLATYLTPEEKELAAKFEMTTKEFREATNKVEELQKAGSFQEANELRVKVLMPLYKNVELAGEKLLELQKRVGKEEVDKQISGAETLTKSLIIIGIIVLIAVVTLSIFVIRSVTTSITKAVTTINEGARQISSASDQVASSSTSLAQGASEQANSVEEVSAALEETTAGVTSNTENARQADILAKQANAAAKEGLAKGEELVGSMKEVTESAAKIANIVKTIDQIAFQVNLLALNAAVEAARAGEHGLGFAVVADEVRNLAQRAANSAKETGVVIEEAVTQIKKSSEIANLASNSFREIDDKAKKVSDLIGEVALSSREQAEGLAQLNVAVSQIDQVTQQVAANSEEAAAAAEELNAQAAAALEAVAALAKIVGIDVNQIGVHQKSSSRPKMELKKDVKHIASKPTPRPQAQKPSKNADEIFPLDESDLKEF